MKKITLLFTFLIFACQSPTKISEKEVMETFDTFFEVIDNDLDSFESLVTNDFFIFENSRHYSKEEFIDAIHNNPLVKKYVAESRMLRRLVARKNFDDAFRKMDTDDGGEVTFIEFWRFMQAENDTDGH